MKKENKKVGRPEIEKDPKRKQMNVMVSGDMQENEKFKERIKYMSFSAYVNSLIDADITPTKISLTTRNETRQATSLR